MRFRHFLPAVGTALAAALLASACGNKGALTLPPPAATASPPAPTGSAPVKPADHSSAPAAGGQ